MSDIQDYICVETRENDDFRYNIVNSANTVNTVTKYNYVNPNAVEPQPGDPEIIPLGDLKNHILSMFRDFRGEYKFDEVKEKLIVQSQLLNIKYLTDFIYIYYRRKMGDVLSHRVTFPSNPDLITIITYSYQHAKKQKINKYLINIINNDFFREIRKPMPYLLMNQRPIDDVVKDLRKIAVMLKKCFNILLV